MSYNGLEYIVVSDEGGYAIILIVMLSALFGAILIVLSISLGNSLNHHK